jgi:hypothetical protein
LLPVFYYATRVLVFQRLRTEPDNADPFRVINGE